MSENKRYEQWICFEIADETYAHRVNDVQEILSYVHPVPVPGSPEIVEGVLNIRGEIVTVVSSRRYIGLTEDLSSAEHIIVLLTDTGPIGIVVDKVQQISVLDENKIEPIEQSHDDTPIRGTIQHHDQLLILTDFIRGISSRENNDI